MDKKIEIAPENPSSRKFPLPYKWQCDYCKGLFLSQDDFIAHLEKRNHRVCYKCGQKVGGWKEWVNREFIAKRSLDKGIETYKYVHVECPVCEPSKRGKHYVSGYK